jgi:membrane-associated phospholipid phosphatase
MRKTLARLITNILNPFLAAFVVIILLSFKNAGSTAEAVKWASLSIALSVLPVFVVVVYLVRRKKLDGIFVNPRWQRTGIYLLATALGAIGYWLLWYLQAPALLIATFAAGFVAVIIYMGINLFWKISLHMAFIAGAMAILIVVYRAPAVWTVLLLLLVAWARVELKQHSLMQVAMGALIAMAIVVGIFWGYGMV